MQTTHPSENSKLEYIRSQATDGYCYILLLATSSYISEVSQEILEEVITKLKSVLGERPIGIDAEEEVIIANSCLGLRLPVSMIGSNESGERVADSEISSEITQMMESKRRFTFSENNGVLHLELSSFGCECTDIYCQHGWKSKFIFFAVQSPGRRVGSINFSDFFPETREEHSYPSSDSEDTVKPLNVQCGNPDSVFSRVKTNPAMRNNISRALDDKTEEFRKALDVQTQLFTRMLSQLESKKVEQETDETIGPTDSSSNLGRYKVTGQYMRQGSVLNCFNSQVSNQYLKPDLDQPDPNPVIGFVKTPEILSAESASNELLVSINGLANPFKNNRLNLLCHIHTSMERFLPDPKSFLSNLAKFSSRPSDNPSDELLRQVFIRTLDFTSRVVKANPYHLPYIEVGFRLDSQSLEVCLDLLWSEYRTLWFEEFKTLNVPGFHKDYKPHRMKQYQSQKDSRQTSSGKSRPKTILGI